MDVYPREIEEGSNENIVVDILDDNGDAVVPSAASWSLYDFDENVINFRLDVFLTPASQITIPLVPADFVIIDNENPTERRKLILKATVAGKLKISLLILIIRNEFHDSNCP